MKRAVTDEAKEEKAKLILDTAFELFKNCSFHELKMIDVAKAAKVAKGTLFNYFSTKETLFIEMLNREYELRFETLLIGLTKYESMDFQSFKAFFLEDMKSFLYIDNPLIRLMMIKSTILEQNIDAQYIIKEKIAMHNHLLQVASTISNHVPELTQEDMIEIFTTQSAIVIGYANMNNLPQHIQVALVENNLMAFQWDFQSQALLTMEFYLEGLYTKKRNVAWKE